jgi:hypothetical protein
MSFSDEDIRAMVQAGQYSEAKDAETIAKTLIDRRDRIASYWFSRGNPLDGFSFSSGKIAFKDLAVDHGFSSKEGSVYHVEVMNEGKKEKVAEFQTKEPAFNVPPEWIPASGEAKMILRVERASAKTLSPTVTVLLNAASIQGIQHED